MPKSNPTPLPVDGFARDPALDLTRASITLLVIAHHAVLAYHRYAPPAGAFTGDNLIWAAFPVVDAARGPVLDTFTLWNDTFFMAMMFLLAGLFVPSGLLRKGAGRFLRDRAWRLGVPFVVSAAVLAPLAYYPAYLLRADATGNPGFWKAWWSLGVWPAGPAWFLWVLLAFSAVAAGAYKLAPRSVGKLETAGAWLRASPGRACLSLLALALAAYLPTVWWVNPFTWFTGGPFTVQQGRLAFYAGYFLFGCALGSGRGMISGTWMAMDGPLARRWQAWQWTAGAGFAAFVAALLVWLTASGRGAPSTLVSVVATMAFVLTGGLTTFALLACFARWGHRGGPLAASLARNAFGMYLVHYAIVTWLQYGLLGFALPGLVKAGLVTASAIGASWMGAILLRRLLGDKIL